MENNHQLHTQGEALRFILGGNALVTMVSEKTGARYTYRVRRSEDGRVFFVSLLTGPNNEADYTYLGILRENAGAAEFALTAKSKLTPDSLPVRGFRYVFAALSRGEMPGHVELWHEGRCGRCGRTLTVPESIASGIGPECAGKLAGHSPFGRCA